MKKRIISAITAAVLALTLTACGEESEKSSSLSESSKSSDKTSSVVSSDNNGDSSSSSSDTPDPPASTASGNGNAPDLTNRHFYKSVAFYAYLNLMLTTASMLGGGGYGKYESAVVLDYDTTTGKILRKRVCVYYCGDRDPEDEERSKQEALTKAGAVLGELPYTVERFTHPAPNDRPMCALVWELPESFVTYDFESAMDSYFVGEYNSKPPQDIDGFFYDTLYSDFENDYIMETKTKPYPYIGSNFYHAYSSNVHYTVAWYDTPWSIEMYNPMRDVEESLEGKGGIPLENVPWSPEEYGSTSFNTGGGYTGTYRYEDCLVK